MDNSSKELLIGNQISKIDPKALYILIHSSTGVLLEDLTPLLSSLEAVYRKLFILRLDKGIRQLLYRRQKEEIAIHGVSRSINSRYHKLTIAKGREYLVPANQEFPPESGSPSQLIRMSQEDLFEEAMKSPTGTTPEREYMPHRIELARSRISSPGFIELVGDPQTLTILVAFLGSLLLERHHQRQHSLAVKRDQRETISTLVSMGYSKEVIASITQYLDKDLSEILEQLHQSKAQLAPGDKIDPTFASPRDEDVHGESNNDN